MACGTPVVATAVGGIPEQIKSLAPGAENAGKVYGPEEATGLLIPPGGPGAMAAAIDRLLADDRLRRQLGDNAAREAVARFDLRRQVNDYLAWYAELLEGARRGSPATPP
jgi:glycosyltransferase involved in cell wall biosynthesis